MDSHTVRPFVSSVCVRSIARGPGPADGSAFFSLALFGARPPQSPVAGPMPPPGARFDPPIGACVPEPNRDPHKHASPVRTQIYEIRVSLLGSDDSQGPGFR
eukprot:636035-Prorocentrum_minimum.AAC.1